MASPISLPCQCGSFKGTDNSPRTVSLHLQTLTTNTSFLATANMSSFPPKPVDTIGTSFNCNCIFAQADKKKPDWSNVGFKIREGMCHDLRVYTPRMNAGITLQHGILQKELGRTRLE